MFNPRAARWRGAIASGLFLLCSFAAAASTNDYVVLITIDGLGAFYLSDARAVLPTLRKMAAEGGCADGLRVSNPATTWPNHTTLITGVSPAKHSVLFNGLLVRGKPGDPVWIQGDRNQPELIAVPTIYDRLHPAGYRTAALNWPCTRGAATLDDNIPDAPDGWQQATPRLRAELVRDGILDHPEASGAAEQSATAFDRAWTKAAIHLLRVRPPNLLLLHLVATDAVQHRHGPQSPAAYAALSAADEQVGQVLRGIEASGLLARTTVLVASDHGFVRPVKLINPNVLLRKAGLLRPAPRRRAQSISEGGIAFVFLTQPATAARDREKVIELLRPLEGVAAILRPEDYPALHLPAPSSNPQAGDLLLVAKAGYTFSDESFDDEAITPIPIPLGSHGCLASDPRMNGVLIAWGRGIRPGVKLGVVDIRDVAPTITALLGENLPGAEGHVLTALLLPQRGSPIK